MSASPAVNPTLRAKSATPLRPRAANLTDTLRAHSTAIREKKFADLGLVSRILLGVADDSAYFKAQAHAYLKDLTKMQGLAFEWDQTCRPKISEILEPSGQTGLRQFVFPDLWAKLPDIPDPRYRRLSPLDPIHPKIPQHLEYFASGYIHGLGGSTFYVLQPVLQIAIQPFGVPTFLLLRGSANPWDGKHPALLVEKRRSGHSMAFLVGGKLEF